MMRFFYTLGIRLYALIIRLISPFNERASYWYNGRKNIIFPENNSNENWIWIHAASLGEFEQGRPIIEKIKKEFPQYKILLTFFSPSGFEIRKDYTLADFVAYIPVDTPKNAARFLDSFKPKLAIFIKYEYWYNHLNQLIKRDIPYYFVSSIYRTSQPFFRFYGAWFRKHLASSNHIFCQDESSKILLKTIGIENVTVSGDTRFDRVANVTANPKQFSEIEEFAKDSRLILAGSTWPADEDVLKESFVDFPEDIKLVIAPHLVDYEHINQIIEKFNNYKIVKWSEININTNLSKSRILVIDKIGILVHLYQYSYLAYIGGGFGVGIHNTLEAAAFSKPVIFGPRYEKFREAIELIKFGGAFSIQDSNEFSKKALLLFSYEKEYLAASSAAGNYVQNNIGATDIILDFVLGKS